MKINDIAYVTSNKSSLYKILKISLDFEATWPSSVLSLTTNKVHSEPSHGFWKNLEWEIKRDLFSNKQEEICNKIRELDAKFKARQKEKNKLNNMANWTKI
jgi:hypothetical protein